MGPDGCRETRETGTGSLARKLRSDFNLKALESSLQQAGHVHKLNVGPISLKNL